MGNCLILEQKSVISVMKTDGKIIEYKAPIKVHQILCEYSHHAITDKLPVVKHLHPNTELIRGRLYYLLPLPVPAKKKKKRVRFSDDVVEEEEKKRRGTGAAVRIKVVISKKELQAMLAKEGVSVEEVISEVRKEPIKIDSKSNALKGLESIPELD